MYTIPLKILTDITATTTSGAISVDDVKKASLQFTGSGMSVSGGSCTFICLISNDGTNYTAYNRLTSNATNTNTQTDTRVASVNINSSTTSAFLFIPKDDYFRFLKVTGTVTSDGVYGVTLGGVN